MTKATLEALVIALIPKQIELANSIMVLDDSTIMQCYAILGEI